MRYKTFGRKTGLRVSEYALGTANFSTSDTGAGPEASRSIFEAFVAAGGTRSTRPTLSRRTGGNRPRRTARPRPRRLRGDHQVHRYERGRPSPGTTGNSRKTMIRSLEASLRRLNTDYVDVFMPHFPDGTTPLEEILTGLDDLTRSGKVLYGGLSNFPAWRVAGAVVQADLRN